MERHCEEVVHTFNGDIRVPADLISLEETIADFKLDVTCSIEESVESGSDSLKIDELDTIMIDIA